jgi:dTMP kinase
MANIVYQGHAGGLDPEQIRSVGSVATAGVMPDCTFLLDVAPEVASRRIDRPLDRMESRGEEYRARLREGFLKEAAAGATRVFVIDAARPIDVVQGDIWRIAERELHRAPLESGTSSASDRSRKSN